MSLKKYNFIIDKTGLCDCFIEENIFGEFFKSKDFEKEIDGFVKLHIIKKKYKEKKMLDESHFAKIRLSDEIFVLNVDGYIGNSTKNEIKYAKFLGKKVKYLDKNFK